MNPMVVDCRGAERVGAQEPGAVVVSLVGAEVPGARAVVEAEGQHMGDVEAGASSA